MSNPIPSPSPPAQITKEDDSNWPPPDRVGRQELEVVLGNEHISFATTKLGSLLQVRGSSHWGRRGESVLLVAGGVFFLCVWG